MNITLSEYKKRCDMDLIRKQKYDINHRAQIIVQEVQDFVKKCEDEARAMYFGDEKK